MQRSSNKAMLTVVLVTSSLLAACVELKQAGRTVGHTTRDVAKQIGHGTRDVAKNIGHGGKSSLWAYSRDFIHSITLFEAISAPSAAVIRSEVSMIRSAISS